MKPLEPNRHRRRLRAPIPRRRGQNHWPALAVLGLVLATAMVLSFNQQHSGDPLKVRREMRKF
jgi:hypothetical protein